MNELFKSAPSYQKAKILEQELSGIVSKNFYLPVTVPQDQIMKAQVLSHLQDELNLRNMTCQDCFVSLPSIAFNIPTRLESLISCNNDSSTLCGEKLKLIQIFLDKAIVKLSFSVTSLGAFVANRHISLNEEYHGLLLKKLEPRANIAKYETLVKTLGGKEKSQEFAYVDQSTSNYFGSFETIFRIMKENIYQPHLLDLTLMEELNFTGSIETLSGYPNLLTSLTYLYKLKSMSGKAKKLSLLPNLEPFIPYCKLANKWSDLTIGWGSIPYENDKARQHFSEFCTLFKPSLTDNGICYSFNGVRSEDLLNDDLHFMKSYKKVFGHKMSNRGYFQASGTGVQNGIEIVLDAHTLDARHKTDSNAVNTFKLSLQHPEDFPLPVINGLVIKGGFRTSIVISPQVLKSTENIQGIDESKRQCSFSYENESLSLFKFYNYNACQFECMWKKARKLTNCVPWYYIQDSSNSSQICHTFGNFAWTEIFRNNSNLRDCKCLYDCNKTVYPYFTNQHELTVADCESNDETFVKIRSYIEEYQKEGHLYDVWQKRALLKGSTKALLPSFNCSERLLKDIAIVEIFYGSPFAMKFKIDVAATFMTKLASIGHCPRGWYEEGSICSRRLDKASDFEDAMNACLDLGDSSEEDYYPSGENPSNLLTIQKLSLYIDHNNLNEIFKKVIHLNAVKFGQNWWAVYPTSDHFHLDDMEQYISEGKALKLGKSQFNLFPNFDRSIGDDYCTLAYDPYLNDLRVICHRLHLNSVCTHKKEVRRGYVCPGQTSECSDMGLCLMKKCYCLPVVQGEDCSRNILPPFQLTASQLSASSFYGAGSEVTNVIANPSTVFSSGAGDAYAWLQLDFGTKYELEKVIINWNPAQKVRLGLLEVRIGDSPVTTADFTNTQITVNQVCNTFQVQNTATFDAVITIECQSAGSSGRYLTIQQQVAPISPAPGNGDDGYRGLEIGLLQVFAGPE